MGRLSLFLAIAALATLAAACAQADGEQPDTTADELSSSYDPYAHRGALSDPARQPSLRISDRAREGIVWAEIDGPLFDPGGPSADDFAQHSAGDCYFLAAMASLAIARPRILRDLIDDNGDGTFTVHFRDGVGSTGPVPDIARPIDVVVDRSLPWVPNGRLLYVRRLTTRAIWPAILEKAYAKLQGGSYQKITGGHSRNAFFSLAGWQSATTRFTNDDDADNNDADSLYTQIANALATRNGVTLGTRRGEPTIAGLIPGHAYTVFDATTDSSGHSLIGLRNPWGEHEPGNDAHDDGYFYLRTSDVLRSFHALTIAGATVTANNIAVDPTD